MELAMRSRALALALSIASSSHSAAGELMFLDCSRTGEAQPGSSEGETATIIVGEGLATMQADLYSAELFRCETSGRTVTCKRGENDQLSLSITHLTATRQTRSAQGVTNRVDYRCIQSHQ